MRSYKNVIYYCPLTHGGIADYAHEQAQALAEKGVKVQFLCAQKFPNHKAFYFRDPCLFDTRFATRYPIVARRLVYIAITFLNNLVLLFKTLTARCDKVLLAAYSEYAAPFWFFIPYFLKMMGVRIGSVVHDPVRDIQIGYRWFHQLSVFLGYSFVKEAFVHEEGNLNTIFKIKGLNVTVIPVGPFRFPLSDQTRSELRIKYNVPVSAPLFLAFGHLRDSKNLDLIINAMKSVPEMFLLVAGEENSENHKPGKWYQELAEKNDVANRCRWNLRYIDHNEVADLFLVSDFILLVYRSTFRSASAVFHAGCFYNKLCVASSGESNLKTMVSRYRTGIWVEPDSTDAIIQGLKQIIFHPPVPEWDTYKRDNNWETNADLVMKRMQL